jgi:hypothetical protein
VGPVDKRFGEVELAAVAQVFSESAQDLHEHSLANPFLQPTVARLIRRISAWQRVPRRTCPQHPQDSVEYRPSRHPRPPFAITSAPGRDQRLDDCPLLVGEFHVDV